MRPNVLRIRQALLGLLFCSTWSLASDSVIGTRSWPAAVTVAPIFGELLAHPIPAGFRPQHEQTSGQTYLRSMVLETDADNHWTQRILVSGTQGIASAGGLTPKAVAMQIAGGFQKSCPTTFSGGQVLEGKTPTGHNLYIMIVSCGSHSLTNTRAPTSETALVAVVQGDKNYYSVQWSERSPPTTTAPQADIQVWGKRLDAISPIFVCERKAGEAAPYPSCTQRAR